LHLRDARELDALPLTGAARGLQAEPRLKIARLDVQLRAPRTQPPNIDKLRAALLQRAEQWKADLRGEPKVARLLLRRLVGPLTMWDPTVPCAESVEWGGALPPALLEGLAPVHVVASPRRPTRLYLSGPLAA
jgi:hypothetical protein